VREGTRGDDSNAKFSRFRHQAQPLADRGSWVNYAWGSGTVQSASLVAR
jgi:hypothetical protein